MKEEAVTLLWNQKATQCNYPEDSNLKTKLFNKHGTLYEKFRTKLVKE